MSSAADGSGERTILTRGEQIRAPSWRPDGQRLVFAPCWWARTTAGMPATASACPTPRPYNFVLPLVLRDRGA